MRGEYLKEAVDNACIKGSPPHARGILEDVIEQTGTTGITPACAGNTVLSPFSMHQNRDHPRMRGEYNLTLSMIASHSGSPPHARGIPLVLFKCAW